ncbi:restriction endonuclease subunit S [Pseudomonas stutzeri]|nr:restriction endonuclease subunit S [Stutzerimonas stutzeri]MCQ4324145.1 restriction endonuclease subunit S [Stutzerimonas stutzeri]
MPSHWGVERLRFSIQTNPTKSEIKHLSENLSVSFVPMEAVGELGGLCLDVEKEISEVSNGYSYFADGDVLIAKITPCFENGKGAIAKGLTNGVGFGTTEFHVLRCESSMNRNYLFYLSVCHAFREIGASQMLGAGGQKRVTDDFIRDFRVGLPSLLEQEIISDFLDYKTAKIDRLIEKKKELIEKLQEQRIATITHVVTKGIDINVKMKKSGIEWLNSIPQHWQLGRIKEYSSTISKGTTPSTEGHDTLEDGPVRFIKAENIASQAISEAPKVFISEETNRKLSRSTLKQGDLLFVIAGATLGKVAIIDDSILPANINQAIAFIRPKSSLSSHYLCYWLESSFIKEITWLYAVQSAQPNLAMGVLGRFPIPLPPKVEQEAIVQFLNLKTVGFNSMLEKTQQAITRLQEYRAALITAAVTGQIDVRNWQAPEPIQEPEADKEVA